MVETPCFYDGMTGRENLLRSLAFADSHDLSTVDRSLDRVGLLGRAQEVVKTYSLGMRQRLGIARALLGEPRLLILDEPTNGLDPRGMKEVRDLLGGLARDKNLTVLISSHLLGEVDQLCNRIGILDKGRLVAEGTQAELGARLGTEGMEVDLRGPDLESLRLALDQLKGAKVIESPQPDRLRVVLAEMGAADLNRWLLNHDQHIDLLLPIETTLEDSYLGLTEEGI
jgi:ABC-2 type transport system ATP-binding protein